MSQEISQIIAPATCISPTKKVMISEFRENEVLCWLDLNETGICPSLLLIHLEYNYINLHMEALFDAITLNDIIENHTIPEPYRRPFCLYIYKGLLSAVKTMHDENWTHRDLHAGNVMIQKNTSSGKLDIKFLDFGTAKQIYDEKEGVDYTGRDDDILQIVRLFSALYTGQLFESAFDLKENYKSELDEAAKSLNFSYDELAELFQLVELALTWQEEHSRVVTQIQMIVRQW